MTFEAAVLARLDRIGDALAGMQIALERVTNPDPVPAECVHPQDQRVEFGGMGEADGFQCRACGVFVDPVKLHD